MYVCGTGSFLNINADPFETILKNVVEYLERNSQHKLTKADISAEKDKPAKAVNATQKGKAGKSAQAKGAADKTADVGATAEVAAVMKDGKSFDKSKKFAGKETGSGQPKEGPPGGSSAPTGGRKNFQKGGRPRPRNKYKGMKCFCCSKIGHIASQCYFNKDNKGADTASKIGKPSGEAKPGTNTSEEVSITGYR